MIRESIYEIACEMLRVTNIFDKNIEGIKYHENIGEEDISLLGLIKKNTKQYDHRLRGKTEENLHRAYLSIEQAMCDYIEDYPVSFSFRQRTRKNFGTWLEKIRKEYSIQRDTAEELKVKESDIGVAMLKILHDRKGVTYEDIHTELEIGERAIQKDLVKLCPSLYTGDKQPYAPLRLGGQPLHADISLVTETESAREKRFYTPNTVHPLVLQENILQLSSLLKALCHQYYDYEDDISVWIATDIWSQMSEYARQKMFDYFAFTDPDLKEFLEILKDEYPDGHTCGYHTERYMLSQIEMNNVQKLERLMKIPGGTGRVILTTGKEITAASVIPIHGNDDRTKYEVTDKEGNITLIILEQIKDIILPM